MSNREKLRMARFALAIICITVAIAGSRAATTPLSLGMSMATTAYNSVCWYETLKAFPVTHAAIYGYCDGGADHVRQQIENPNENNKKYFDFYPDKKATFFGTVFISQNLLSRLPDGGVSYKPCEKYMKDAAGVNGEAPADEGDALNDGGNKAYPYRAFSYCMMKALRNKHGDKAIEAVKSERTHSTKDWRDTLLDRENEFRQRHGVEPFKMEPELNAAAQKWAETNAKDCKMYHSKNTDADRPWRGAVTGENLATAGGRDDAATSAYLAAAGWYEEIKDYPFPEGIKGMDMNLFMKVGHFTQMVWKGSLHVGYGYAYNPKCAPFTRYVAARYSPAGNVVGFFPQNVNPPKD